MNNDQLKKALMTECPVIYIEMDKTPVKYAKVSRIIYSKQHSQTMGGTPLGQVMVSAELQDMNRRSVRIVDADRLIFAGSEP